MNEHSLQMFVDNELDGAESALVANHLRDCAPCSRQIANVVRLKRATHQAGQRFAPSAAFTRKMMGQVAIAKPQRRWMRFLVPMSSGVAIVALIAMSLALWPGQRSGGMGMGMGMAGMGQELADLHVATMASANPVDVVSSDKHTVKPWFTGKLPFTFDIPELQGSGYELLGGRMAYLHQSPAAQLVFRHGKHHCSIFIVEERSGGEESSRMDKEVRAPMNFTIMKWRANGLVYLLVTDASPDTMRDLEERMKKAAAYS